MSYVVRTPLADGCVTVLPPYDVATTRAYNLYTVGVYNSYDVVQCKSMAPLKLYEYYIFIYFLAVVLQWSAYIHPRMLYDVVIYYLIFGRKLYFFSSARE